MEWVSQFIIYRTRADLSAFDEVFHTNDFKKAKYWLTYIAQPGDVCCRTPRHAKYAAKDNQAEYWSHKAKSGLVTTDARSWSTHLTDNKIPAQFPAEQFTAPEG